tara:strand:- start:979 stop:1716 length:738 start_codon:yes stop_codon:yes gene_type:complete
MNIKNIFKRNKNIDLEKEELEIIDHVHEFGSTIAREIMTPRVDIRGFPGELLVQDCLQEIKTSKYSRFPIYKDNLDEILGVIHVKDIIKNIDKNDIKLSQIDNKVIFVPESMPINDVLKAMKKQRQQMVIVVGEYGGTEGLVTFEDVIEELVGEIEDEYDFEESDIYECSDGSYIINSKITIDHLNEQLELNLPEGKDYDSLAGLILNSLGYIPKVGEIISVENYKIEIQKASIRQIELIRLSIT